MTLDYRAHKEKSRALFKTPLGGKGLLALQLFFFSPLPFAPLFPMQTNNCLPLDPVTDPAPPHKDPECTLTEMDVSALSSHDSTVTGTNTTPSDDVEEASKDSTDQVQQSYSFYRYDWTDTNQHCLASTQTRYNLTIDESVALDQPPNASSQHSISSTIHTNNFFKSCQWSPDGTCLLTNSEDRIIRVFDM